MASLGSIKGNQSHAVKVFGYLKNERNDADDDDDKKDIVDGGGDFKCDVWFPNAEKQEFQLFDNGLLSKFHFSWNHQTFKK